VYFGTSGLASNPQFGPTPNFDAVKCLTAVGPVSSLSFMVAASPNFPADDAAGLVALARARPGKVSIGSGSLQVQVAQLTRRAGIDLMHVPYKGGAQAAADAIGGHVDTVIALVPALISSIQNGKLKPIGIAAPSRAAGLPQVPTFTERGVPANINLSWFGLFVPTGTPAPIVSRLGAALRTAVTNPGLVSRMTAQGVDMTPGSAQDLAETLKRDYAEYGRLAQELK
ncbi:MAG: tripartite tricarboxylate transporter substrate binding protein, partial [Burkholderiaceae bacterium]